MPVADSHIELNLQAAGGAFGVLALIFVAASFLMDETEQKKAITGSAVLGTVAAVLVAAPLYREQTVEVAAAIPFLAWVGLFLIWSFRSLRSLLELGGPDKVDQKSDSESECPTQDEYEGRQKPCRRCLGRDSHWSTVGQASGVLAVFAFIFGIAFGGSKAGLVGGRVKR